MVSNKRSKVTTDLLSHAVKINSTVHKRIQETHNWCSRVFSPALLLSRWLKFKDFQRPLGTLFLISNGSSVVRSAVFIWRWRHWWRV